MIESLFADAPHAGVQEHLVRVFGMGRVTAALLILALTTFGSLLGSYLWSQLVRLHDHFRYGGWTIRVRGGRSGRAWHMPLDTAIARSLGRANYVLFKRDLGTVLSGEGNVDFTLGVPQAEPCRHAPPQAPGLTIDFKNRTIEMDFTPARAAQAVPAAAGV
jgi:hypothetical protein